MIERFRLWLKVWLGIDQNFGQFLSAQTFHGQEQSRQDAAISLLQSEIKTLRAEVTRLSIAQYVPPSQPEPERKIIQTRTMREFNAILEKEFEHEEIT